MISSPITANYEKFKYILSITCTVPFLISSMFILLFIQHTLSTYYVSGMELDSEIQC